MESKFYEPEAMSFSKAGDTQPTSGRTDGVFTVVLPSVPSVVEDEVLVAFESGDLRHDVDGRDFLVWQRGLPSGGDVAMETITIAHESMDLA
jgi:hypothetical protein